MTEKIQNPTSNTRAAALCSGAMICPCCGFKRERASIECESCGAVQVGEPLAQPDHKLPMLGPAIIAVICAALVVSVFLAVWIFGNDMKVGRAMLVYLAGDGTKFTSDLLKADPKLPYYRIFTYDAYRLAFTFSFVFIPLSLAGVWLARRAKRLASGDPANFGGISMANLSLALSTCLLIIFSSAAITAIPGAIERGRAKRLATTRAMMYRLHEQALQKYYLEYGSYPQDLTDLSRVNADGAPQSDYWENNFNYAPVSVIASKGSAISFSNYKLVSAGPDGKFGTKDDISMVDGVIVDGQPDEELPTPPTAPEKSRR